MFVKHPIGHNFSEASQIIVPFTRGATNTFALTETLTVAVGLGGDYNTSPLKVYKAVFEPKATQDASDWESGSSS